MSIIIFLKEKACKNPADAQSAKSATESLRLCQRKLMSKIYV